MITYDYIDNFLEINKHNELKEYKNLFFKKLKEEKNLLNIFGFKNTKNITYYFNLDYLLEMKDKDILFNTMANIFDKSPEEGNYIVANFLEVDPSVKEYSPSLHFARTVCKFLKCDEEDEEINPEAVGVLYLNVPNPTLQFPEMHWDKVIVNGNKKRSNEELQNEEDINSSQPGGAQRQQVHDFVQQRTEQQQPGRINYCRRSIVTRRQGSDY